MIYSLFYSNLYVYYISIVTIYAYSNYYFISTRVWSILFAVACILYVGQLTCIIDVVLWQFMYITDYDFVVTLFLQ